MKRNMLMFLFANSFILTTPVMAAEYCYQDDYVFRADAGDSITSGIMMPSKLANERIGFPYDAQLAQIRITPLSSTLQMAKENHQPLQHQKDLNDSSKSIRVATVIPQSIEVKAFQGIKVNLKKSQNSNCQPCTAIQKDTTTIDGVEIIELELCSKLAMDDIKADLVFTRK